MIARNFYFLEEINTSLYDFLLGIELYKNRYNGIQLDRIILQNIELYNFFIRCRIFYTFIYDVDCRIKACGGV